MKSEVVSFLVGFFSAICLVKRLANFPNVGSVTAKDDSLRNSCHNLSAFAGHTPPLPCPTLPSPISNPPLPDPPKRIAHPLGKEGFVWPSQKLGVAEHAATERPFQTPALSLPDFLESLRKSGLALHGFIVNVGAADGCLRQQFECDEANQLLPLRPDVALAKDEVRSRNPQLYTNTTFQGVLFEPGPLIREHNSFYVEGSYTVISQSLSYSNAVASLEEAKVPKEFDAVKYDTDSADCDVLNIILEVGYRPSVVMAEFNIVFPPPLRFNQMVTPDGVFRWGAMGPHHQQVGDQCSLSHLSSVMAQFGYTLVQVDWWDAFYVRNHLVSAATGGAPIYDDLSWYLHGYVDNAPSNDDRIGFLKNTAYQAATSGVAETWIATITEASKSGKTEPLDVGQQVSMRTDFWWLAAKEGFVQVKDVKLVKQREVCHDGCIPQPFTLA